jgi:hypothetical protein
MGIICSNKSEAHSPVDMVNKNAENRECIDFRQMN